MKKIRLSYIISVAAVLGLAALSGCATTQSAAQVRLETARAETKRVTAEEARIAKRKDASRVELTESRRGVRDEKRAAAATTAAERGVLRSKEAAQKVEALKLAQELCADVEEEKRAEDADCKDFVSARKALAEADLVNAADFKLADVPDFKKGDEGAVTKPQPESKVVPSVKARVWLKSGLAHVERDKSVAYPDGWKLTVVGTHVKLKVKGTVIQSYEVMSTKCLAFSEAAIATVACGS